jgi:hypothetical protein
MWAQVKGSCCNPIVLLTKRLHCFAAAVGGRVLSSPAIRAAKGAAIQHWLVWLHREWSICLPPSYIIAPRKAACFSADGGLHWRICWNKLVGKTAGSDRVQCRSIILWTSLLQTIWFCLRALTQSFKLFFAGMGNSFPKLQFIFNIFNYLLDWHLSLDYKSWLQSSWSG